jgi:hypothetical protein
MTCIPKNLPEFERFKELAGARIIANKVWKHLNGEVDHLTTKESIKKVYDEIKLSKVEVAKLLDIESDEALSSFSDSQISELVDNVIFLSLWDGKNQKLKDISEIDLTNIKEKLEYYRDSKPIGASEDWVNPYYNNIQEVLKPKNLEALLFEARRKLAALNIEVDSEKDPDEKIEGSEYKDNNLIKNIDKARANTRLLVAFIMVDKPGSVIGLKKFIDYNSAWNDLEYILKNLPDSEFESDRYKLFIKQLKKDAAIRPEYISLIDLLESSEDYKKTQFLRSFDNYEIEYAMESISDFEQKGSIKGYSTKYMSSEGSTKVSRVINNWDNTYLRFFIERKGDTIDINTNHANKVLNNYDKIKAEINSSKELDDKFIDYTVSLLSNVGIRMSNSSLNSYLDNQPFSKLEALKNLYSNNGIEYVFKGKKNSVKQLANLKINVEKETGEIISPIRNEKAVRKLAEIEKRYRGLIDNNSQTGPDGNRYQTISDYDFISKSLIDIKNSNRYLNFLSNGDYHKDSTFIKHLKDDNNKDNFKQINFLSRRYEGEDAGVSIKKISMVDETASRIDRVVTQKQLPYFTVADKSKLLYFSGLPTKDFRKYGVDKDTLNQFISYFATELNTMRKAWEEVYGENKIPEERQIQNYHYKIDKKTGERVPGNAFTITSFPELSPGTDKAKELNLYNQSENNKPFPISITHISGSEDIEGGINSQVETYIKQAIESKINRTTDFIMKNMINVDENNNITTSLSKDLYKDYLERYDGTENIRTGAALISTNFTINTLISNIEFTKLFTGDPRMYSTLDDYLKRIPATTAAGSYLRLVEGSVNEKFNVAVAKNVIYESELLSTTQKENIYEFLAPVVDGEIQELSQEEKKDIDKILEPYLKVNRTDAQAWITPERFREILIGLGDWNNELEVAFKYIMSPTLKTTAKHYEAFSKTMTSMQPRKGVHYELINDSYGNLVPVYLKYSQAVLFPEFISSSPTLSNLYNNMVQQNISEVIVGDGIKSGAIESSDISQREISFKPIELSNKNWKLQVELPYKGNSKDSLVGSQAKKNIIADILYDEDYDGMSGKELLDNIHKLDSELSNRGLEEIMSKFTIDGKLNQDFFYDYLISEFKKEGASSNLIEALEKRLPLDSLLSHRDIIWNKISSLWNKSTVKLKQPGGAAIQLSDFGFELGEDMVTFESQSNIDKNGIVWLTNDRKLKPPRVEKDESGNVVFSSAQALLPYDKLAELFGDEWENIKNLPLSEIVEKIDKDALKMIGYRIPNQEMASNDSIEIVGILPKHAGDTIVLYSEITTKTGSDFDIDKMFYILPSIRYNKKTKRVETVKFLDGSNSTIQERAEALVESTSDMRRVLSLIGFDSKSVQGVLNELESWNEEFKLAKDSKKYKLDPINSSYVDNILSRIEKLKESKKANKSLRNEIDIEISSLYFALTELVGEEEKIIANIQAYKKDLASQLVNKMEELSIEEQNTKKALYTRRVDLYRKVLESKHTFTRLLSTVDSEWNKSQINLMLPKKKLQSLDLYDGIFQMNIRREFMSSKNGVGQAANHQGDHAISQDAELFIRDIDNRIDIGNKTDEGDLDLSSSTGNFDEINIKKDSEGNVKSYSINTVKNKYLITQVISAYMNAFVDAAKDNYIGRANFNSLTNNTAFMLIRNGVSPQYINAFISQPAIKRYVELTDTKEGQAVEVTSKKPLDLILEELGIKDVNSLKDSKFSDYSTKELMDIVIDNSNGILPDPLTQAKLLNLFLYTQELSKTFGKQLNSSKFDTNGHGKNIIDALVKDNLKNNIYNMTNDNNYQIVGNFDNKFNGTMLETYYKNSTLEFINIFSNETLATSPNMIVLANKIYSDIYGELPSDSDKLNRIFKLAYAGLLAKNRSFNKGINNEEGNGIKDLMKGKNSMANRITKLKANPVYNNNKLIDILSPKLGYYGNLDYVSIDNTKERNQEVNDKITKDWLSLYRSANQEERKLAKDLVIYAFHSSALMDSMTSMYRLIPYQILLDMGVNTEYYNELKTDLHNPKAEARLINELYDQVFKNLWRDTKLIPKVGNKKTGQLGKMSKEKVFTVNDISSPHLKIGSDKNNQPIFKPYLTKTKYVTNPITGATNEYVRLYKYIGNIETGKVKSGVYERVSLLGQKTKYGGNNFYEFTYFDNENIDNSIVPSNNFKLDKDTSNELKILKATKQIVEPLSNTKLGSQSFSPPNMSEKVIEEQLTAQTQTDITTNYNPTNVSEEKRQEFAKYVTDNLGEILNIEEKEVETEILQGYKKIKGETLKVYDVTFEDGTIKDMFFKGGSFIVDQDSPSKVMALSDIKLVIGIGKLIESSKPTTKPQVDEDKFDTIVETKIKLKDGNYYNSLDISLSMLEQMEYSKEEIGEIFEKICSGGGGAPKAEKGAQFGFTPGSKWKIIKDFKGKSHEQGGIDINISNDGIKMSTKNGKFKAENGIIIGKNSIDNSKEMLDNIYNKYPAFKNMGELTVKADPEFTRDKTGAGDIEYFSPNDWHDKNTYNTGYIYNHPKKGTHAIVYNPKNNDQQSIMLDMLHGMTSDPVYSKHRSELSDAILNKYKGDFEGEWKDYNNETKGNNDGKETFKNNWIDGKVRSLMFEGTPEDYKKHRYWEGEKDLYFQDKNIKTKFNQLKNYLKTGNAYTLPEIIVKPKR